MILKKNCWDKIFPLLFGKISRSKFENFIDSEIDKINIGESANNNLKSDNILLKLLKLSYRLNEISYGFKDERKLLFNFGNIVYLCLTCFDTLGQANEYIEFPVWLQKLEHNEREYEFLNAEYNLLKWVKSENSSYDKKPYIKYSFETFFGHLYDEYNKTYGTTKAFKRAINSLICRGKYY